ncbi:hypothetical protein CC86DRAFT_142369 [Ophiobolus disseminans]|uniref:Uncharacterized protein n=1 Tax=Ophiobolus disseminans TaxID=1469910 RepID=A0A6A7AG81_9PLEO|nr:hypothetical protein CC86DRAFT_142369 [Ophiobolus disseminans]
MISAISVNQQLRHISLLYLQDLSSIRIDTVSKLSYTRRSLHPSNRVSPTKSSSARISAMSTFSKLNPFAKKETEEARTIRLAAEEKNEAIEHEKKKAEVMKYRGYTEEQAEAHLAKKKDGLNSERGLRALGTALAPQRLST